MERRSRKRIPGLTGTELKVTAMISMAVDHTAVALVWPAASGNLDLYWLYWLMRAVGRLAFPIYGFLLVQGNFFTPPAGTVSGQALRLCPDLRGAL